MMAEFVSGLQAPFANKDWWDILNSSFITTFVSAGVGLFLAQRVNKVAQTNQAENDAKRATEAAKADLDEADKPDTVGAPQAAEARPADPRIKTSFKEASKHIDSLKAYVEAKAQRVSDGRTKRKYENIPRNDYRIIVGAIEKDGGWSADELVDLDTIFDKWRPYSRGRVLVPDDYLKMIEGFAKQYKSTADKPAHWKPIKRSVAD